MKAKAVSKQQTVDTLRHYALRLSPDRRVRTISDAATFVHQVGLARLLTNGADGFPSLYAAVCGRPLPKLPKNVQLDAEVSLTWELKDSLIELGLVYYAKLIGRQPTFAVPELIPALVKLYGKQPQKLSPNARAVYRALKRKSPQPTLELRSSSGLNDRKPFDAAIEELQVAMLVIPYEVCYEAGFTYVWGLTVDRFPQVKQRLKGDPVCQILRWHLQGVRGATAQELARRFRLTPAAIRTALLNLADAATIAIDQTVDDWVAVADPVNLPIPEITVDTGWD